MLAHRGIVTTQGAQRIWVQLLGGCASMAALPHLKLETHRDATVGDGRRRDVFLGTLSVARFPFPRLNRVRGDDRVAQKDRRPETGDTDRVIWEGVK